MVSLHLSDSPNALIGALSDHDRERLAPHFERVPIARDQVLVPPNERIEHVYFLEGGIASITSLSAENGRTEVGIFGREGVSGTSLLLGADRSPHETFIQATALKRCVSAPHLSWRQSRTVRRCGG